MLCTFPRTFGAGLEFARLYDASACPGPIRENVCAWKYCARLSTVSQVHQSPGLPPNCALTISALVSARTEFALSETPTPRYAHAKCALLVTRKPIAVRSICTELARNEDWPPMKMP